MKTTRLTIVLSAAATVIFAGGPTESAQSISANSILTDEVVEVPFPSRPEFALTGSQFLRVTKSMNGPEREQAILEEIRSGNVPSHLRRMVPLKVRYDDHLATVFVLPDYLAIGSDDDFITIPMAPRTAMHIANEFGFTLPTRKLVDEIYSASTMRLSPEPLRPSPKMTSNDYYIEHDRRIKSQLSRSSGSPKLIAGHKKDVVLTERLVKFPHRVAIYGWHRQVGNPIQPLSLVHGIEYVDYSHGVRLISRKALVDGVEIDLSQVLSDSELNPLVSDEGRVSVQGYL